MKKFYRVCHKDTLQGLWYDYDGEFTGYIHNRFDFCTNSHLKMDYDDTIVGWLSAVENLDDLWQWFSREDIINLQNHGWYIHEFEAVVIRFYEPFQHTIINQSTSKVIQIIELYVECIEE